MAGRDERIAANEARARVENEERGQWFRTHGRVLLACECYMEDCEAMISLTRREYEHVRANPVTFAVSPGHLEPTVERVAEKHDMFWVTEKPTPDGKLVAEELDPRS